MIKKLNVICLLLALFMFSCKSTHELLTSSSERERGNISIHPTFMQEIQPDDLYVNFGNLLSVENVFNYIKANKQGIILDQEVKQTLARLGIRVAPLGGTSSSLTSKLNINPSTVPDKKTSTTDESTTDESTTDTTSSDVSSEKLYEIIKEVTKTKNTAGLSDSEIEKLTNTLVGKIAGLPQSQDGGVNVPYHELLYATANSVLGGKSLQNFYDFRKIPENYSLFIVPVVVSFNPGTVTSKNYMGKIKLEFSDSRLNDGKNFKILSVAPAGFSRILSETISSLKQNAVSLYVEANIKGIGLSSNFENLSEKLDQLAHILSKPDFHVSIEDGKTVTFYYMGQESFKKENRLNNVNFNAEIFVLINGDILEKETCPGDASLKDPGEQNKNVINTFAFMKDIHAANRNIYGAQTFDYTCDWEYIPLFKLNEVEKNKYYNHHDYYGSSNIINITDKDDKKLSDAYKYLKDKIKNLITIIVNEKTLLNKVNDEISEDNSKKDNIKEKLKAEINEIEIIISCNKNMGNYEPIKKNLNQVLNISKSMADIKPDEIVKCLDELSAEAIKLAQKLKEMEKADNSIAKEPKKLICNRIKNTVKLLKVDSVSFLPGRRIIIKGDNFDKVDSINCKKDIINCNKIKTIPAIFKTKAVLRIQVYKESGTLDINKYDYGKEYVILTIAGNGDLEKEKKVSVEFTLIDKDKIADHQILTLNEEKQPETAKQEINIIHSTASVYPNHIVFNIVFNSNIDKYPKFFIDGLKTEVIDKQLNKVGNNYIGYEAIKLGYTGKIEKKSFTLYVNDSKGIFQKYQNINIE